MENNKEHHIERTDFDRSQCANAVPLLENRQLYPVSSELTRLGKQNHQAIGKGYPIQLS